MCRNKWFGWERSWTVNSPFFMKFTNCFHTEFSMKAWNIYANNEQVAKTVSLFMSLKSGHCLTSPSFVNAIIASVHVGDEKWMVCPGNWARWSQGSSELVLRGSSSQHTNVNLKDHNCPIYIFFLTLSIIQSHPWYSFRWGWGELCDGGERDGTETASMQALGQFLKNDNTPSKWFTNRSSEKKSKINVCLINVY